jgi:hypothetical protein
MAVLFIAEVHGAPRLDLELVITGNQITANIYTIDGQGGTFSYSGGIDYSISAGGTGFTVNTGTFNVAYGSGVTLVSTATGTVGDGDLEITASCAGEGSCYSSGQSGRPYYDSSRSSDIDSGKITVDTTIAENYQSQVLAATWMATYVRTTPPSGLALSRDYLENPMTVSYTPGTGTFSTLVLGVRRTPTASDYIKWNVSNLTFSFPDDILLACYDEFQLDGLDFPNNTVYIYVRVETTEGNVYGTFDITVGGTAWGKNAGVWRRAVPYNLQPVKPCIMYTKIAEAWKRGNP